MQYRRQRATRECVHNSTETAPVPVNVLREERMSLYFLCAVRTQTLRRVPLEEASDQRHCVVWHVLREEQRIR